MSAGSIFRIGCKRALRRPGLICGLWLLSQCIAILALLPAGIALYLGLAESPAAFKLARGHADVLWAELLFPNGSSGGIGLLLISGSLLGIFCYWLLQTLLAGGILGALLRPGHPAFAPPGRVLLRAAETFSTMLRLELLGLLTLRLPLGIATGAIVFLFAHRPHLLEFTMQSLLLRLAPLGFLVLLLFSMGSVVLYYARAFRMGDPAGAFKSPAAKSASAALFLALRLVFQDGASFCYTLGLGLLSVVGYAALVLSGRLLVMHLDTALLVLPAFALRQLFALARAMLAVCIGATAAETWHQAGR